MILVKNDSTLLVFMQTPKNYHNSRSEVFKLHTLVYSGIRFKLDCAIRPNVDNVVRCATWVWLTTKERFCGQDSEDRYGKS